MPPRARWKGSLPDLAKAIGEKVEQPTDIDYDGNNEAKFDKVKLEAPVLQCMLRNLHALDEGLNFKKKDIQGALCRLYASHPEWPQTEAAKRDYNRHVTKRVMNAIDHFKKAKCRSKPAQWAVQLLKSTSMERIDIIDENVECEDGEIKEPPAAQDTFFYGFSKK